MNSALILVHVLTCLVAVNYFPVFGQGQTCCTNCCDNTCAAPPAYNITLDDFVAMSPLYINFFPAIPLFAGYDNVCITYVALPDGTYLETVSTVYCNGYNTSESFITSQSDLGVFQVGSGTCELTLTIFDLVNTTDCTLYLAYLCFNYGDCTFAPGDDIPVFGLSSNSTPITSDCLATAENVIATDGVPPQDYFPAPSMMADACVTNLNCTNAYCNGYKSSESFIISQSGLGVFDSGSGTCAYELTVFDFVNTTDCSLYLAYVCFTYGSCSFAPGDNIPVFGLSSNSAPITPDCLATAESVIANDGVPAQDYFAAPSMLADACVTNLNCTNA